VWLELGRLHEEDEECRMRTAYEQALDALPTFHEAALALADLLRRSGRVQGAVVRLVEMLEQDPYDSMRCCCWVAPARRQAQRRGAGGVQARR